MKRKFGIVICVVLCVFAAVAAGMILACHFMMSNFYKLHFFPETYIGNTNVGGWTVDDVKSYYSSAGEHRTLYLDSKDRSESLDLDETDMVFTCGLDADAMLESQDYGHWYKYLSTKVEYEESVNVDYDAEKLGRLVTGLPMMSGPDIVKSEDAYLTLGENGYEIIPEFYGNELSYPLVMKDVEQALAEMETLFRSSDIHVDVSQDYLLPAVYADDANLVVRLQAAQKAEAKVVNIDLTDVIETIDKDEIDDWMTLGEDASVSFDKGKVETYVNGLSGQYCTLHATREFKTSDGDVVKMQSDRDSYGFVLDQQPMIDMIMDALVSDEDTVDITAVWNESYCVPAQRSSGQGDIGDTYVEVSIDKQHVWFYQNGECVWDSDCVSGLDTDGRRTPTGVYFIWNKESPSQLRGSYGSTWVQYWMAFTWDGCGLHDAPWRGSFGGSIWRTDGSHGCVNLPSNKAKELYDIIPYKTPVVVYGR